jgi:hypothetical protein
MEFLYNPTSDLTIGFGQTKPEITNVIFSNSLELTDRSINNSKFNIDRDFDCSDYSKSHPENFSYSLRRFQEENWVKTKDDGIALTGKVELFPRSIHLKTVKF